MSQETILVTGAAGGTGSTAREAIAILLEQGRRVRAMVRTLDARADALRDLGAEVVVADMLDIVAVRAAMRGCAVVYFTMSVSPNYLEAAANVAVTAKSLGVNAFVNLAQMALSQMSETETVLLGNVVSARHCLCSAPEPSRELRSAPFFPCMTTCRGVQVGRHS